MAYRVELCFRGKWDAWDNQIVFDCPKLAAHCVRSWEGNGFTARFLPYTPEPGVRVWTAADLPASIAAAALN